MSCIRVRRFFPKHCHGSSNLKEMGNMQRKKKLSQMVTEVKNGNNESVAELVERLMPIIKRCCRKLGYDGAESDLVEHIVKAAQNYNTNSSWRIDEIVNYFSNRNKK